MEETEFELELNKKLDYLFEVEAGEVPDFERLELYASDSFGLVRAETATALGDCFNEQAEKILLKLAHDKYWLVRAEAVDVLGQKSFSLQVLKKIKRMTQKDRSMVVRAYAVLSFYDIAAALQMRKTEILSILEKGLENERSNYVRYQYYRVMYELGEKEYLNKLFKGRYEKTYTSRCSVSGKLFEIVNQENAEEIKAFAIDWLKEEGKRSVHSGLQELLERCETVIAESLTNKRL